MTVASMTGFGRAAGSTATLAWTWEVKSVNGRTLDVRLKLPSGLERLDAPVRRVLGQACQRGSLQVVLLAVRPAAASGIRLNETLLLALHDQLKILADRRGLAPVPLKALLGVRGVIETEETAGEPEDEAALDELLMASFGEAVSMLTAMRHSEGAALSTVLTDQLNRMAAGIAEAASAATVQGEALRRRLHEQVTSLMDADSRLDPQRLHQEAVLLATRADVREELDRFTAHVAAARTLLQQGGAIGRRLDFLAQELFRETNTICSKAASLDLTAVGLDIKSLVEQFREQVQNVE